MIHGDLLTARVHLFKALADRTRLRILEMLSKEGELSVTEIYRRLGRPQNLISHHLACLKNCGLAKTRKQGKQIYYSLRTRNVLKLFSRADAHVRDVLESVLACEIVAEEESPTAKRSSLRVVGRR
jgi:DNA-binding transcriptional ArsR family regulator